MKKIILFSFLVIGLIFPLITGQTFAQDNDEEEQTTTETDSDTANDSEDENSSQEEEQQLLFQVYSEDIVNARSSASTTSNVAGVLQPGSIIEVIETVEGSLVSGNSIWYRIQIGSQDAYVHSSLLVPVLTPNQNILLDLPDSFVSKIIVQSTGSTTIIPNLAIIQFGFERVGTDTASVYNATELSQTAVVNSLIEQGMLEEDINASIVTVSNEDVIDATGGITGEFVFRTQALLTVYVHNLTLVQDVIDAALTNGANSIKNVTYTMGDFKVAEDEALANGLMKSLEQARFIANQSQIILGPVLNINISPYQVIGIDDLVTSSNNVQIPSNPQQLIVSVEIRIEYAVNN